jgi:hypothetical protein
MFSKQSNVYIIPDRKSFNSAGVKSFRVYSRVVFIYLLSHQYVILGFNTLYIKDA